MCLVDHRVTLFKFKKKSEMLLSKQVPALGHFANSDHFLVICHHQSDFETNSIAILS